MTAMAMTAMISAYSTTPWPFSSWMKFDKTTRPPFGHTRPSAGLCLTIRARDNSVNPVCPGLNSARVSGQRGRRLGDWRNDPSLTSVDRAMLERIEALYGPPPQPQPAESGPAPLGSTRKRVEPLG